MKRQPGDVRAVQPHTAPCEPGTTQRFEQLGTAGTQQAVYGRHLAGADVQVDRIDGDVAVVPHGREVLHAQNDPTWLNM